MTRRKERRPAVDPQEETAARLRCGNTGCGSPVGRISRARGTAIWTLNRPGWAPVEIDPRKDHMAGGDATQEGDRLVWLPQGHDAVPSVSYRSECPACAATLFLPWARAADALNRYRVTMTTQDVGLDAYDETVDLNSNRPGLKVKRDGERARQRNLRRRVYGDDEI